VEKLRPLSLVILQQDKMPRLCFCWGHVGNAAALSIMPPAPVGAAFAWRSRHAGGGRADGIAVIVSLLEAGGSRNLAFTGKPVFAAGLAPGMAFDRIGKARGVKVPDTERQRDWVESFHGQTATGGINPA